ncbi:MAG: exodeoxyribonuclease VII large subunit [Oscillospiraceae bacterium]|nr:exodeoxyribonuclease VII large subunit [Oscillospiraceae bacterium]
METMKPVFSVHELTEYVDLMLGFDPNLKELAVEGELEGVKRHVSGHLYFTLKDELASVNCVMFRQYVQGLRFIPKDGQRVRLAGRASLYQKDGRFQLMATGLAAKGDGSLYAAFAAYKEQLKALGWFDESGKKPIPFLPGAVGLVTSASGAARHDVETVVRRRFPSMPVVLYPASVQGAGAAKEIADAIDLADAEKRCDVLIVGRGGGSMEDLWPFNEPPVAEAIHRCTIPVISAVGHETDFSISDYVADLRAPTPSAAAELAVPERDALQATLSALGDRLGNVLQHGIRAKSDRLKLLWGDAVRMRVRRAIEQRRQTADENRAAILLRCGRILEMRKHRLEREKERLYAYSPQRTLERGFAWLQGDGGAPITRAADAREGQDIAAILSDGKVLARGTGRAPR